MEKYISQYPEITIDKSNNSPNSMQYKLAQEEFYDLMHHTHKLSDLLIEGNNNNPQEIINNLINDVNELKNIIKTQNEIINKLVEHAGISAEIGDWDAITPGIQDIEGNTVGSLLGMDMIEIE